MTTGQAKSQPKGHVKDLSQNSASPEQSVMQKKLVTLPQKLWEELRKKGYYVPKGDFSAKFFARKLLHFSFVKDITFDARKLLFINLMKEMFPTFDSTICKGFAEVVYTEADRQLLLNIAEKMDDNEEPVATVQTQVTEFAEEAD